MSSSQTPTLGALSTRPLSLKALGLSEEDGAVLLAGLRRHEGRLMLVGVELLALDGGIESLHAVPLEGLHEDGLGHCEAVVEVVEILVAGLELVGGDVGERAVEIVDAVHEVFGEALDGKVLCGLHFALGLVLEVTEVGDAVLELVLLRVLAMCHDPFVPMVGHTVASRSSFFLVSSSALTGSSSVLVSFSVLASSAFFVSDAGASEYILKPDILCDTAGVNCWEMKAERWSLAGAAEGLLGRSLEALSESSGETS